MTQVAVAMGASALMGGNPHSHIAAHTQARSQTNISSCFEFVRTLNTGSTAAVHEARDTSTGQRYAVKVVQRTESNERILRREVRMQRGLNHPNIAKAYKFIETPTQFFLVQEYLGGGDLFDAVAGGQHISEAKVMAWMRGVLRALVYLHEERYMAHRDIKLENVVRTSPGADDVRIIDFGFACDLGEVSPTVPGTEEYVCPELLAGIMDSCLKKADVWAAGVLMWTLLCSNTKYDFPWTRADDSSSSFRRFKRNDLSAEPWRSFSNPARFLLLHMLAVNPAKRCTAREALEFINEQWPETCQPPAQINSQSDSTLSVASTAFTEGPVKRPRSVSTSDGADRMKENSGGRQTVVRLRLNL